MLRRTAADDDDPPEPYSGSYSYAYDDEDDFPRRLPGGRKTTVALWFLGLVFLAIAVLRVAGIDGNVVTIYALTLTPYIAGGGLLLFLIAFLLRRRILALAVLLLAISMVVLVLPRMLSEDQPEAGGVHVRVLAANLNDGRVDPAQVLRLVRDNKIDVAALPELSHRQLFKLDELGIVDVLPYRVVDPGVIGGDGSGIFARFPLRQTALVDALELSMPSAVVDLPGRDDIEIVATHVQPAVHGGAGVWQRDLGRQPPAIRERVRVLAGDFNATFDHAAFRALLDRGYVDAAEQTGKGLIPTWSDFPRGLPLTVDHVLVDHRCAVRDYGVLALPGSEHDAVFADLQLP